MSDLHIILHCLPREIDELDRIVNHLKRSSHFLESKFFQIKFCENFQNFNFGTGGPPV